MGLPKLHKRRKPLVQPGVTGRKRQRGVRQHTDVIQNQSTTIHRLPPEVDVIVYNRAPGTSRKVKTTTRTVDKKTLKAMRRGKLPEE